MNNTNNLLSQHKTLGVFTTQQAAEQAKQDVSTLLAGDTSRVIFIEPSDPKATVDNKLENEYTSMGQTGIFKPILISTVISMIIAVAIWAYMYKAGSYMFVHEVWISLMGAICVFLVIGVMFGVAVAYASGRNSIIMPVKQTLANGKWVVIAYPKNESEAKVAIDYFKKLHSK